MADELTGVSAFVPIANVNAVQTGTDPVITVYHRPNDSSVTFLVKREDITQIIPGGDQDGHRLMQIDPVR
jgi:hypothetical protein